MGWNDHVEKPAKRRQVVRQARASRAQPIELTALDGNALADAATAAIEIGGALRIGATRDGGAWAIGIYGDGAEPYTEYVRPGEDINTYMHELAAHLRGGAQG